jgi:hypothetical protein
VFAGFVNMFKPLNFYNISTGFQIKRGSSSLTGESRHRVWSKLAFREAGPAELGPYAGRIGELGAVKI